LQGVNQLIADPLRQSQHNNVADIPGWKTAIRVYSFVALNTEHQRKGKMKYDDEFPSPHWAEMMKDPRRRMEAQLGLEMLAIALNRTQQELIDEYCHTGDLDSDDWQPYSHESDESDCEVSYN
jgi:hypothetical protein